MANSGIYPFVVSTPPLPLEIFRVLLNDTDPVATTGITGEYKFFSDMESNGMLSVYASNPRLAAARALETIAVTEALLRKWVTMDQSLDGPATANALRQLASQMRQEVLAEGRYEDYFDIIKPAPSPAYTANAELASWGAGPIPIGVWPRPGASLGDSFI